VKRLLLTLVLAGCGAAASQPEARNYTLTQLTTTSNASFRGVSVVNERVVWASGSGGTVLRSVDGGASWSARNVAGADSLDFRDIEAFDSARAYVLSAGEDGRIYKTRDGGRTWTLQFKNTTKGAFFDCFDFWSENAGIAMSDPVGGRFLLIRTEDGRTWQPIPSQSHGRAQDGEAAFAASGTCIVTADKRRAYLATGGGLRARVLVSNDRGDTWTATPTPLHAGTGSAGIFSLAFADARDGIAIGGDYQEPAAEHVVARTTDGGRSWEQVGTTAYVSGAAYVPGTSTVVAVGTKGTRISRNHGATWATLDTLEYNAVQFATDGTGFAVGPRGRIARLGLK
jgi:photosystem II stability/assembly factor-like uncharacterized protein